MLSVDSHRVLWSALQGTPTDEELRQPQADSQQAMEDPSPSAHQQLKASNSQVSLKVDPSLVKFSDKTLTLADALMTASQGAWSKDLS